MSKKQEEYTAASALAVVDKAAEEEEKQPKQNIFKMVGGIMGTAKEVASSVNEFYKLWVKPIYDNRAQISRRLNAISTIYSIIFFTLYVPFLLFSKIAKGLSLGWEVALYVCIGVYAVTLVVLLMVSVFMGKSTSTEMAKRRRKTLKVVLMVVRLASVAMAITALIITATSSGTENTNHVLHTVGIIFSVVSIIFSALPLIFGGLSGFAKWLISPAKIKRTVSFVTLEWYELVISPNAEKFGKKINRKYFEAIAKCIDGYVLPTLGPRYAKVITGADISAAITAAPEEEKEVVEAILRNVFDYAVECGYVTENPCSELGFSDDIEDAIRSSVKVEEPKKGFFRSLFKRK